jgi:TonB-linked SusC/RagA family outer membrane protein
MRKIVSLLLCFCFTLGTVFAQNSRTLTGKVTDEKGAGIANASVLVKGSTIGTTTGNDGAFSLKVPESAKVLVVSSVNFGQQEVSIGKTNNINISLKSTSENLQEVVVVGYGTKSIRENTGAVSKIKGDKIAEVPTPSFDQALAGKTAGVQVNATGGVLGDGVSIRVRGVNSISSSSQPLIVIDGVPQIELSNLNGFNGGNGTRFNPLALVNANDIESFEVLKDAGSSSIYGSRAANGVILITTKKGKKGTAKVNVDIKLGLAKANKLPDLLSPDEFAQYQNEKAANRYGVGTANAIIARDSDIDGDGNPDRTNWLDLLYRTAQSADYGVTMSGGAEKVSYFASARYISQNGISLGNKLTTGQARLNLEISPKTWFKSGFSLSYSKTLNNGILSDRYIAGSTVSGWQGLPNVAAYNPNGPSGYNLTTATPIGNMGWGNNTRLIGGTLIFATNFANPIASIDLSRQNNIAEDTRASAYGEIQFFKGLKMTSRFGIQNIRNFEDQYTSPLLSGLGQPYNGLVQNQDQQNRLWNWQNYLTYDKTIAEKHKIGFTAGMEYQKNNYFYTYVGAANFSDPFFQYVLDGSYSNVQPGTTTTLNLTGGDKTSSGLESYFSRLNYSFDGKYFVEGSIRRDAFSGFGEINRWGNFPSVSAGWELTKEKFLNNVKFLDYLKLRASYGKVGNSRGIGPYDSRTLYGGALYTVSTGLGINRVGNAGLQWESSNKTDIGVEANFLKNRISIVVDYFKNDVNNLILSAPTLYTVGVPGSNVRTNIGGMVNKGIEITINATPVVTKNFKWSTSFNYTNVKNTVTGLVAANNNADISSGNITQAVASLNRSLGTFWMANWAGVDAATGNPMWYAANGTLKRFNFGATGAAVWTDEKGTPVAALGTADWTYQDKSGLPTFYGGWDNTFTYRDIELSMSLFYSGGNYLYNQTRATLLTNFLSNNSTEIKNSWKKPGDVTDVPRTYLLDNTANQISTRFLEKGDFLRMRTITLAYTLNRSIMQKIGFDGIRIYGQVLNAFTITGYSGIDPEVNTNRTDNIGVGIDLRNVPQPRQFTFGIQASF